MIIITLFQSIGIKVQPLILSLLRKGGLDIPFMFMMNALLAVNGIVWATPIADFSAMLVAIALFIPFWHQIHAHHNGGKKPDHVAGPVTDNVHQ